LHQPCSRRGFGLQISTTAKNKEKIAEFSFGGKGLLMSGDNGGIEPREKTQEEILAEKKAAFEADPDKFVCMDDLILAAKRGKNGIDTLIAPASRTELEIALMRITHQCYGVFNAMSMAQQQAQKKIVQPKHGVMDFVRRKRR
jgi:hypothetical protein